MNTRSKADPIQIQQMTFNEDAKAIRVDLVPTEMNMTLDHRDGDSVYAVKRMVVVDAKAGDVINCEEVETICRLGGGADLKVDVLAGESVFVDALELPRAIPVAVCVPTIQVKEDCVLVLRG